jgi:hypothetical protein
VKGPGLGPSAGSRQCGLLCRSTSRRQAGRPPWRRGARAGHLRAGSWPAGTRGTRGITGVQPLRCDVCNVRQVNKSTQLASLAPLELVRRHSRKTPIDRIGISTHASFLSWRPRRAEPGSSSPPARAGCEARKPGCSQARGPNGARRYRAFPSTATSASMEGLRVRPRIFPACPQRGASEEGHAAIETDCTHMHRRRAPGHHRVAKQGVPGAPRVPAAQAVSPSAPAAHQPTPHSPPYPHPHHPTIPPTTPPTRLQRGRVRGVVRVRPGGQQRRPARTHRDAHAAQAAGGLQRGGAAVRCHG